MFSFLIKDKLPPAPDAHCAYFLSLIIHQNDGMFDVPAENRQKITKSNDPRFHGDVGARLIHMDVSVGFAYPLTGTLICITVFIPITVYEMKM